MVLSEHPDGDQKLARQFEHKLTISPHFLASLVIYYFYVYKHNKLIYIFNLHSVMIDCVHNITMEALRKFFQSFFNCCH